MEVSEFIAGINNIKRRIEEVKYEIDQLKRSKGMNYDEIPDSRTVGSRMMDADESFSSARRAYQMVLQDPSARRHFETKKEDAEYTHNALVSNFKKTRDVIDYSRSDRSTAKLDELLFELQSLEKRKTSEELDFIKSVDVDALSADEKDELRRSVGEDLRDIRQTAREDKGREADEKLRAGRNREYYEDRKKGSLRTVENLTEEVERQIRRGNYLSFEGNGHTEFMDDFGEYFKHIKLYVDSDMDLFGAKVAESEKISDYDRATSVRKADCLEQIEALCESMEMEQERNPFEDGFLGGVKKQTEGVTRSSLDELLELLDGPKQSKEAEQSKETDEDKKKRISDIEALFL